jgi:hypothetical protein
MTTRPSAIVKRLGHEQAAALSAIVGGTKIDVPGNLTSSAFSVGRLRKRLGDGLFALLVFHFGGTRIYVPQVDAGRARIDGAKVARLTQRGWSAARIARKIGCSDRAVYRSRAKARAIEEGSCGK